MTIWIIIGIVFFIVVYVIWEILRPVKFVKPGGIYSVGTLGMEITDTSRIEDASKENKYRRLILQFWYPAAFFDQQLKGVKGGLLNEHKKLLK